MLSTRLQTNYTVADLVDDLGEWIEDGYVDTAVWKRLQNHVSGDALPTFSTRARLHKMSASFECLELSSSGSAGAASYSATNQAEDDNIRPKTTGRNTFQFTFSVPKQKYSAKFALCFKIWSHCGDSMLQGYSEEESPLS